ncbi:hypothetical protein QJS66_14090 [Kocuria rhizophila]|nr:hypothetical protein QJS66_14090 [Kocuria rhizophila]
MRRRRGSAGTRLGGVGGRAGTSWVPTPLPTAVPVGALVYSAIGTTEPSVVVIDALAAETGRGAAIASTTPGQEGVAGRSAGGGV